MITAWWQSLTTLEHVLLYIAVPATLLLLIQTILLFLGGVMDTDTDADGPELDVDGPDLDGDLDSDWDGPGMDMDAPDWDMDAPD